jgi:hypothetical protein
MSRRNYGGDRCQTLGYMNDLLLMIVWTPRGDDERRVIWMRKPNPKEQECFAHWRRSTRRQDEDIACQIAENPDTAPEWTDKDFNRVEVWEGNRYLGRGKDVRAGRSQTAPPGGTGRGIA